MAEIIDGKKIAQEIRERVAEDVATLNRKWGIVPGLAVVLVGDDPGSKVYVAGKQKACQATGIRSVLVALPEEASEGQVLEAIAEFNRREDIHGILVQLPLPRGIERNRVLDAVLPRKDVDGFHPLNVGKLVRGSPAPRPCTPAGIMEVLERIGFEFEGQQAVVVGRSEIVGKPIATMLLQRNATVTICHSRTRELETVTARADLLVVAAGRPELIRGEHVKPGAVVIDVGINRVDRDKAWPELLTAGSRTAGELEKKGYTLVGDVHFASAAKVASFITPVPGGVGPLTIAMLLVNTVQAAQPE